MLINILSIAEAVDSVIRVGELTVSKKEYECKIFRKSLVGESELAFNKLRL